MALTSFVTAALLGGASLTATDGAPTLFDLPSVPGMVQAQAVTNQAEFMTTPEGCTYRRTQAPGYPPRWILIVNPHHIGKAPATMKCPGML
ncbi:hypothetical protein [Sagittula sp. SSi028]|uniref:hypothetical protein n=1 Tax=Sagittula sp. SSi028 TaxID=3400636 RepID=UPI003AF9F0A9